MSSSEMLDIAAMDELPVAGRPKGVDSSAESSHVAVDGRDLKMSMKSSWSHHKDIFHGRYYHGHYHQGAGYNKGKGYYKGKGYKGKGYKGKGESIRLL